MHSNLARYFKDESKIDIVTDPSFVDTNLMFKSMIVKAKMVGKGIKKPTIPIDDCDLKRLTEYFNRVDHMNKLDPHKLQQYVFFNIMYFSCR